MAIYALVDVNNIVQTVIEYDGVSPYTPPDGLTLELVNTSCQVGDTLVNGDVTVLGAISISLQAPPAITTAQYPTTDQYTAAIYARDLLNDGGAALQALQTVVTSAQAITAEVPVQVTTLQTAIAANSIIGLTVATPVVTTTAPTTTSTTSTVKVG